MAIKRDSPPTASAFAKNARFLRLPLKGGVNFKTLERLNPTFKVFFNNPLKGGGNCSLAGWQKLSRGESFHKNMLIEKSIPRQEGIPTTPRGALFSGFGMPTDSELLSSGGVNLVGRRVFQDGSQQVMDNLGDEFAAPVHACLCVESSGLQPRGVFLHLAQFGDFGEAVTFDNHPRNFSFTGSQFPPIHLYFDAGGKLACERLVSGPLPLKARSQVGEIAQTDNEDHQYEEEYNCFDNKMRGGELPLQSCVGDEVVNQK